MKKQDLENIIDVARGLQKADLVLTNAKIFDVFSGNWLEGDVAIYKGQVVGIGETYEGQKQIDLTGKYLVPGFIDSHVHIESTLMTPEQYQKVVLPRGTTGAIVDPHEISNVLGVKGLEYFVRCAEKSQMDIYVMLSSCVPATTHLETSGARILAEDLKKFKDHPNVLGLAEMMNFPGLLNKDPEVLDKMLEFSDRHIDGHCPMLSGKDLNAYIASGVKTCHESVGLKEAQEKVQKGMQVLLREGSVAKNLKDLCPVLNLFSSPCVSMCSDDRNPVDILNEGHMNFLVKTAIEQGIPYEAAYRSASWSTAKAYNIAKRGAIAPGYFADIVVLDDYKTVSIHSVYKDGELVKNEEQVAGIDVPPPRGNSIQYSNPTLKDIKIQSPSGTYRVIEVVPEQIITKTHLAQMTAVNNEVHADIDHDYLKIAVLERHGYGHPMAKAFVKGFGFKRGAIGSSVGHDSHNAVAVGTNDQDMLLCFAWLKENGGGFVAISEGKILGELPLPIAGLMTDAPIAEVYEKMSTLRKATQEMGCELVEPFLQLSFLCLPVIPELKITDQGLIDVNKFEKVGLLVP